MCFWVIIDILPDITWITPTSSTRATSKGETPCINGCEDCVIPYTDPIRYVGAITARLAEYGSSLVVIVSFLTNSLAAVFAMKYRAIRNMNIKFLSDYFLFRRVVLR